MEADDYDYGPIMYVEEEDHNKKLVDQLQDYLDNTSKEQLEREFFEIRCKFEGIDPNDDNAKLKLWWKDTKHWLKIISHHLGYQALKILTIISVWLGGIFTTTAATDALANIEFLACIIFAYTLLTTLIEYDKDWFFLRKRN